MSCRTSASKADAVLIGGKMAEDVRNGNPFTFEAILPVDVVAAGEFAADAETQVTPFDALPDGWLGLDVGPETREEFARRIAGAGTVFWNGPMGVFEWPAFAAGTVAVARSGRRLRRVHGRRRRRLGARRARGRRRRPHLVDLDGRRRVARAARREGAPRREGDPRMTLIAGNWKMFKGPDEAGGFCRALRDADLPDGVDVVVAPPFVSLGAAVQALAGTEIGVFAQNCHWERRGRVHGRGLRADAEGAWRVRHDRRALGAPAMVRRDG